MLIINSKAKKINNKLSKFEITVLTYSKIESMIEEIIHSQNELRRIAMDIRENVLEIMHDKLLMQSQVAKAVGLTPSQMCAVVKKRRNLSANEFLRFCDVVHMTPTEVRDYHVHRSGLTMQ